MARADMTYQRLPASLMISAGDSRIILDAGRDDVAKFLTDETSICLTSFHVNRVKGLFPLYWGVGKSIDVYCPPDRRVRADLDKKRGTGLFNILPVRKFKPIQVGALKITPIPLSAGRLVFGYCVAHGKQRLAYVLSRNLPEESREFLMDWKPHTLVLGGELLVQDASEQYNWSALLELTDSLKPQSVWLTHINHALDEWLLTQHFPLPGNVLIAHDLQATQIP